MVRRLKSSFPSRPLRRIRFSEFAIAADRHSDNTVNALGSSVSATRRLRAQPDAWRIRLSVSSTALSTPHVCTAAHEIQWTPAACPIPIRQGQCPSACRRQRDTARLITPPSLRKMQPGHKDPKTNHDRSWNGESDSAGIHVWPAVRLIENSQPSSQSRPLAPMAECRAHVLQVMLHDRRSIRGDQRVEGVAGFQVRQVRPRAKNAQRAQFPAMFVRHDVVRIVRRSACGPRS